MSATIDQFCETMGVNPDSMEADVSVTCGVLPPPPIGALILLARMLPLCLLLIAAAPMPATLRDRIVVDAQAEPAANLAFDRATTSVRTGGGIKKKFDQVERWDGERWELLSRNGKPPTSSQRRKAERLAAASPVPGYYRVAELIANATEATTDAEGRTILHIPELPTGTLRTDSADISTHLQADVTLATHGGQPWVERVRITQREPFRMDKLIKVTDFEQVSDYKLDANGKPRLDRQTAESAGTKFGFRGGEKREITYVYR